VTRDMAVTLASSLRLVLLCTSLGAVACAPSEVQSGLPADRLAQELTAAEIDQLCGAVEDYAGQYIVSGEARCRLWALSATSTSQTPDGNQLLCASNYDDCMRPDRTADAWCVDDAADLAECTTSVADMEACYTAHVDVIADLVPKLRSCDDLDERYLAEFHDSIYPTLRNPPECLYVCVALRR
jgi:hypothetical protein